VPQELKVTRPVRLDGVLTTYAGTERDDRELSGSVLSDLGYLIEALGEICTATS